MQRAGAGLCTGTDTLCSGEAPFMQGFNIFSNNFNASLTPPIVKSYAANERQDMFSLIIAGSKATFFLLWIFALPMMLKMELILGVWLTTVPSDAVLFARLALIESLIMSISLIMLNSLEYREVFKSLRYFMEATMS